MHISSLPHRFHMHIEMAAKRDCHIWSKPFCMSVMTNYFSNGENKWHNQSYSIYTIVSDELINFLP